MNADPRPDTPVDDAWHKAIEAKTPEAIDEAQTDWMRLRDEESTEERNVNDD